MEVVLPAPFTPAQHDHERLVSADIKVLGQRVEQLEQAIGQSLFEFVCIGKPVFLYPVA